MQRPKYFDPGTLRQCGGALRLKTRGNSIDSIQRERYGTGREGEVKPARREAVLFLRQIWKGRTPPESPSFNTYLVRSSPLLPPAESTHHVAIIKRALGADGPGHSAPNKGAWRRCSRGGGRAEWQSVGRPPVPMFHHRACCGAAQACPKPIGGWLGTGRLARAFRFPVPGATTAS